MTRLCANCVAAKLTVPNFSEDDTARRMLKNFIDSYP